MALSSIARMGPPAGFTAALLTNMSVEKNKLKLAASDKSLRVAVSHSEACFELY